MWVHGDVSLDNWARGRGWTFWKALITYAALPGSNSREANNARRVIEDLVAEWQGETERQ